jgi:hypothetical protein
MATVKNTMIAERTYVKKTAKHPRRNLDSDTPPSQFPRLLRLYADWPTRTTAVSTANEGRFMSTIGCENNTGEVLWGGGCAATGIRAIALGPQSAGTSKQVDTTVSQLGNCIPALHLDALHLLVRSLKLL